MAEKGMGSQSILMQKEDSKHLTHLKTKKNNFTGVHLIYKELHKPGVYHANTMLPLAQPTSNNRHIQCLSEFPCASSFFCKNTSHETYLLNKSEVHKTVLLIIDIISRTYSSSITETLHPLNSSSSFSPALAPASGNRCCDVISAAVALTIWDIL